MPYAQGGSENEAPKSSGIASLNGTLAVCTVCIRIHIDGTTCPVVISFETLQVSHGSMFFGLSMYTIYNIQYIQL